MNQDVTMEIKQSDFDSAIAAAAENATDANINVNVNANINVTPLTANPITTTDVILSVIYTKTSIPISSSSQPV